MIMVPGRRIHDVLIYYAFPLLNQFILVDWIIPRIGRKLSLENYISNSILNTVVNSMNNSCIDHRRSSNFHLGIMLCMCGIILPMSTI